MVDPTRAAAFATPVFVVPPPGAASKNYAANNAGDQIKTGAGTALGISVNTAGVTSSIVLYDGTSTAGIKLGTWSTTAQGAISFPGGGIPFATGLFAVLAGGTPADVTVAYAQVPLEKGAKPGTEGFSNNVAAEVRAGKPAKQAAAIAYREAGEGKADTTRAEFGEIKRLLTKFFTEEAKEPEHMSDDASARLDALKARCDASIEKEYGSLTPGQIQRRMEHTKEQITKYENDPKWSDLAKPHRRELGRLTQALHNAESRRK